MAKAVGRARRPARVARATGSRSDATKPQAGPLGACLIGLRASAVSLATICRDLPGFTGGGSACGSTGGHRGQGERSGNPTMTVLQAIKPKPSSHAARSVRRIAIVGTGVIGASWTALYLAK